MAGLLGPELYGVYTLSMVIPFLLINVIDFGINAGVTHFCASLRAKGESQKIPRVLRSSFIFKLVLGIAIFSVCFLLSDTIAKYILNRSDIGIYIRLASTSIVFQVIFSTASSAFVGLDRMEYSALALNAQALVKAIVSPLLVLFGFSVVGALTGFVAGFLVAGLSSSFVLYWKFYRIFRVKGNNRENSNDPLRGLLTYGFPLYMSTILTTIVSQVQNIVLAIFVSDFDIGNFNASLNFVALLGALALPIATTLFPAFSKIDKNDPKLSSFFRLSVKYSSLLIVPSALLVTIFSNQITRIIYGGSFTSAGLFLSLHVTLYLLVGLGFQTLASFFNGLAETKTTFKLRLIIFLLFILTSPILTKFMSVPGLIASIILANSASTVYGAYVAKSQFKVDFGFSTLARIYLTSLLPVVPAILLVQLMPLSLFVNVLIGGLVYLSLYLVLLPVVGIVDKPELELVGKVAEKIPFLRYLVKPILRLECGIASILMHQ